MSTEEPRRPATPAGADIPTLPPAAPAETHEPPTRAEAPTLPPAAWPTGVPAAADGLALPAPPGYEIVRELGRGGMGVVYLARHRGLGRTVALKMILAGGHASEAEHARFLAEAQAVAHLQHANIVQLFDSGQHQGLPFFTLEYVAGGSLADKVREAPLPPNEAARVVEQLARGMAYAHARGVVHRDLKPENVLLAEDGTPKVTDFGLAKRVEGGSGLTQTGAILGTPSYMAPEQAGGQGKQVGPAADIYALGAVLYRLVTGRPPFQAATPLDTVLQVISDEPAAVRQLQPGCPRDLETICHKCLQKVPAKRYASAADLAEDLRRCRAGEPVLARPVRAPERLWRWCRRNPALAGLTTAVFLTLIAATIISTLFALGQRAAKQAADNSAEGEKQARKDADEKAALALNNARLAEAKAELARRNGYSARMNQIGTLWQRGDQAELVNALLEGLQPANGESDLRGWEWHYLWRLGHGAARTVGSLLPGAMDMAFSPDGTRLAAIAPSGVVKVFDPATHAAILTSKVMPAIGVPPHFRIAFSPHSQILAVAGGDDGGFAKNEIWAWNLADGRQIAHFKIHNISGLALDPEGKLLAVDVGKNGTTVWDVGTGRQLHAFKGHSAGVVFSSDGKLLTSETGVAWDISTGKEVPASLAGIRGRPIAVNNHGRLVATELPNLIIKVWDIDRGAELHTFKRQFGMFVKSAAFSRDGRLLATLGLNPLGSPEVIVWNTKNGQKVREFKVDGAEALGLSPDGQQLYTADFGAGFKTWDIGEAYGSRILGGHKGGVNSAVFSPNSKGLLAADDGGTVRSWDVVSGKEIRRFNGHAGVVKALAFSADGKRFASVGRDGKAILRDATSGSIVQAIKNVQPGLNIPVQYVDVAFHPDGQRMALARDVLNGEVELRDVATGQLLGKKGGSRVAFSPDGKWMAAANAVMWDKTGRRMTPGNPIKIWDAATLVEKTELRGHFGVVFQIAFSKGADTLASAGEDKTARLWDVASGKQLFELKGHTNQVMSVAFSPDGKRLATASQDRTVKIWDTQTGQPLITLTHEPPGVQALWLWHVAFSPDGRWIAASSQDGTISLWDGQNMAGSASRSPR
jgi:WD40 repeat protein/predicted Ser/Thr protein kinase